MRASRPLLALVMTWLTVACGPTNQTVTEIPGLLGAKADGDNAADTDTTSTVPTGIASLTGAPLLPDVHPPGVMLPANKTEVEATTGPGEGRPYFEDPRDSHPSYAYTSKPNDSGRLPGEFEPVQALLIGWSGGDAELLPTFGQMLAAVADKVPTIVYVQTNYEASQLYNAVDGAGGDADELSFQSLDIDSIWMRDYGPLLVRTPGGGYRVADFRYYYGRWDDDAAPTTLAGSWGVPVSRPALDLEGGNIQSDGAGSCITTTWLIEQNQFRNYSQAKVRQILADHLGCQQTVILPTLQGEGTGHVDMYVTITAVKEAIVGQYPVGENMINAQIADQAAQKLQSAGFFVRRIPMPTNIDGAFRSYTNSLAVGNTVLVPVYADDDRFEAQALNVFQAAYPGRTIVPVDATNIIQWAGAVHCVTMTLAK